MGHYYHLLVLGYGIVGFLGFFGSGHRLFRLGWLDLARAPSARALSLILQLTRRLAWPTASRTLAWRCFRLFIHSRAIGTGPFGGRRLRFLGVRVGRAVSRPVLLG